jgi:hypothetical protein
VKEPAVVKLLATLALLLSPMFAGVPVAVVVNVTLCRVAWNAQVTEPPAVMSTCDGSNVIAVVAWTVADEGTVATVSCFDPTIPLTVAVIVTVPAATPDTTPLEFTVATAVFDDAHVAVSPVTTFPLASDGAAASCRVPPVTTVVDGALTDTVVTAPMTVGPVVLSPPHALRKNKVAKPLNTCSRLCIGLPIVA